MQRMAHRAHAGHLWLGLLAASALAWTAGCGGEGSNASPQPHNALKEALAEGKQLMMADRKEQAIAAYTRAIGLDPQCKEAYLWRAVAYNETGRHQEALADFTKVIELDPRDSYPYEQRAAIYRRVFKDQARAAADEAAAAAIRQQRWEDLKKLRRP